MVLLKALLLGSAMLCGSAYAEAAQSPVVIASPPASSLPDPPAHHPGAGPWPASRISGVIRNEDYPASAMRSGLQGDVRVTLLVGRDGRVQECDVESSSGSTDLDWTTCRLILGRFRYDPARDANGWAIEQLQTLTIVWRLPGVEAVYESVAAAVAPERPPDALPDKIAVPLSQRYARLRPADYPQEALRARAEGVVVIRLAVSQRGRPTGCSVIQSSGHAALDAGTCALARRFHYRAARDRSGRAVPAMADEEVEWQLGDGDDGQPRVRLLGPAGPPYPWVVTTPPKPAG